MSGEYEAAFTGSLDKAVGAMQKVTQQLQVMDRSDNKETQRRKLQLALLILRSICCAASKAEGRHHTVYCDTVATVISKYLKPSIGSKYWTMYLEHLRYLHHIFAEKKLFKESFRICDLMASYTHYLVSEGDYKIILGMYLQHLLCQHNQMRNQPTLAHDHIVKILDALNELFIRMLHISKEYNFEFPELITDFVQYLAPKRVSSVFIYLASLPLNKSQMYESFFTLLKDIRTAPPTKKELQAHCQRHLEAFIIFFQLDITDRLHQQLALRHLRTCRDMSVFANDKSSNYVFSLLYYLVKLFYGFPNPGEFKDVYKDLSGKLTSFFDRYGEMLMQERWFTDVPVVITVLLTHIQQQPKTPFSLFWQHMTNIECYIAHFDLILGCIRLAPRIVETKLLKFECCTSARKHTIITLLISAIAAYSSYAATVNDSNSNENEELFISFRTQLLLIMRHGVSVFDSLACITTESAELKTMYAHFIQLTVNMRTSAQIKLCITLAEFLLRIRHKFTGHDWTLLLRRLYKMTLQTTDTNLPVDLHVAHIASILQEQEWPDISLLKTRIGFFYTSLSYVTHSQSILQLSLQSRSPFKVFLDTKQQHLLHWLETQQFIRYHKSSEQLQIALMDCSPSQYNEVLIARSTGVLSPPVANRLQKFKRELEQKIEKTTGLSRLENLCLAHITTALLHDALKLQKDSLSVETKYQEDNLEDLLQRKELVSVTVINEVKLLEKANSSLQEFQKFYQKADMEPISDNIYIDWEAIIEDLTSLALYMQLSGYTDLSTKAWILHYQITNLLNDDFNALRSLTYFCEFSKYFLTSKTEIDLDKEISRKQNFILDSLQKLPTLPKRFQNYILLYLSQLAYYYSRSGHLSYAQILFELVHEMHVKLPNQIGKYNVVLGAVDVVKFRIMWKHLGCKQVPDENKLLRRSLLRDMEDTLERFRGDFFKLSSSELMSYTILLLSLIEQVAECAANRLCDHFINSYFAVTFKLLLQSGSALRLVQMLSMWAWVNLRMEFAKKAQVKIRLIEYILGLKSLEALRQISEEAAVEKKMAMPTTYNTSDLLLSGMEPIRKMIPSDASPIKTNIMQFSPSLRGENNLNRFFNDQSNEALRQYEILQWCYFMVGCLNARLHFLVDNYDNLEDFYESSQQWLLNRQSDTFLHINFQNIQLLNLQHYISHLRKQKKYDKASTCLKTAVASCLIMRGNIDSVYRINFLLQQNALEIEISTSKETGHCSGFRRALTFNFSPESDQVQNGIVARSKVKAEKKLTTPAFTIYGDNGSTPENTPVNVIAAPQTDIKRRDNLLSNSTHKLRSVLSVRKSKRKLATETEMQTPANTRMVNVRTNSKSLTAKKLREPRIISSESSSNSSNNKPKTETQLQTPANTRMINVRTNSKSLTAKKLRELRIVSSESSSNSSNNTPEFDILNKRIASIDFLDSDDDNRSETTIANGHVDMNMPSANKKDLLNICQQIESIGLFEEQNLFSNLSEPISPTQTFKYQSQDIVQTPVMADGLQTSESTFDQLTTPPNTTKVSKTSIRKIPQPIHKENKNKDKKSNNKSVHASPTETTKPTVSDEPQIQVVEKIKITEDTKATTTKLKTRTKTEVRTLKVITKETEIKIISPKSQTGNKGKENTKTGCTSNTARGRSRTTRKTRPNSSNEENITPSVTMGRALGRRTRQ